MMLMNRLYNNLEKAKAFEISFTNFIYFYGDVSTTDFETEVCDACMKSIQTQSYLVPKGNCRKPTGILQSLQPGVSQEVRDELIARFNISEEDFRPVLSKKGEVVYYQISPKQVILPISEENEWPVDFICPQCGGVQYRHKYFRNEKKEPYYLISEHALNSVQDLCITYERFRFDRPLILISRRVYDYLTERYPRTHYIPFFLKEKTIHRTGDGSASC